MLPLTITSHTRSRPANVPRTPCNMRGGHSPRHGYDWFYQARCAWFTRKNCLMPNKGGRYYTLATTSRLSYGVFPLGWVPSIGPCTSTDACQPHSTCATRRCTAAGLLRYAGLNHRRLPETFNPALTPALRKSLPHGCELPSGSTGKIIASNQH